MKYLQWILAVQVCVVSCSKDEKWVKPEYRVQPTREVITNYVEFVDHQGGYTIDSGRTELVFVNFFKTAAVQDTLAKMQQSTPNSYYQHDNGIWQLRYVGAVGLLQIDSVIIRLYDSSTFQKQTIFLTVDKRLWGKPIFELYHEPTNSVYARYFVDSSGARVVLHFSGPSWAQFNSLPTEKIIEQFNFKLKPEILNKNLYSHF